MIRLEQKKILVTGGTGHLGSALIHFLVKEKNIEPKNIRVFYLKDSPTNSLDDIPCLDFFVGNVLNAGEVNATDSYRKRKNLNQPMYVDRNAAIRQYRPPKKTFGETVMP